MKKRIMIALILIAGYGLGLNYVMEQKSVESQENVKNDVIKTDVTEVEKDKIINDELLTLVNYKNKVPDNWQVNLVPLNDRQSIDQRAYQALQEMLDNAKKEGMNIIVCSSYRTYDKQKQLFVNKVSEYLKKGYSYNEAQDAASMWVAKPNTSEHQLGLAVDLVSRDNQRLDKSQEKTEEQRWLMENCQRYGFILRYPSDKSNLTGVNYEPWHYRYVGKEHAKKITRQGICLEEYLDNLKNS
ncbi:MAG: D-alanyl-D-alanine carboxypeptidase family protein [Thomasclavelia sp.]|uniref:M15 family metallopeptidase n=1 Tax=Thomasclavelia sp. TaxID=3025757 RepID=UPI0039A12AB4